MNTCIWCDRKAPLTVDRRNHVVSDDSNAVQPCENYSPHMTYQEQQDHNERERISRMSDTGLWNEYSDMRKAAFNRVFGHNARRQFNLCIDELLKRGFTEEPNIFGPIQFKKFNY